MTLNKVQAVQNPLIIEEQPPATTEKSLSEYLVRMFRYANSALRRIYARLQLLLDWQKDHIDVEGNPHPQYLKIVDLPEPVVQHVAYAHMRIADAFVSTNFTVGQTIAPYDVHVIPPYNLGTNLSTGKITFTQDDVGIYSCTLSVYAASSTTDCSFRIKGYINNQPSVIDLYLNAKIDPNAQTASITTLMTITEPSTIELRLYSSNPAGQTLKVYIMDFLVAREYDLPQAT
jgi:hypothetical protein